MDIVTLALVVLTTARLTRLVVADRISQPLRTWAVRKLGEDSGAAYFIHCPWCVSIWVGALVSAVAYLWGENPIVSAIALALSASYGAGWLVSQSEEE